MKRFTPLFTLLTGGALAAVLVALSMAATPPAPSTPQGVAAAATASAEAESADAPTAQAPARPSAAPSDEDAAEGADAAGRPANATWAGNVGAGAATIAINAKNGVAIAYLCDGDRIESWLQGTAAGGDLALTGKGGAELTGTFGDGRAAGEVIVGGKRWTFRAAAVQPPAGLYRATAQVRNARVVGGWIILEDGTQVGIVTVDGTPAAAPPLGPANRTTVNGTTITAVPAVPAVPTAGAGR